MCRIPLLVAKLEERKEGLILPIRLSRLSGKIYLPASPQSRRKEYRFHASQTGKTELLHMQTYGGKMAEETCEISNYWGYRSRFEIR